MNKLLRHSINIVIGLFLWSCNSEKSVYERIVSEWQGKQIVLPEVVTDFLTGDTIDLSGADFTILTYVDSVGCTGCKMKLPLWKEFLGSIENDCDADVKFLMVVHPSDLRDLHCYLKSDGFEYPVYWDENYKVSEANSFPERTAFQTFLIDRNRKVTAIGNPVYSSEIAKLYNGIISGLMSVSADKGNFVTVSENKISLGNLRTGESTSREIVFSNHGNDTVRIRKVISSCECTELSLLKRNIAPKSELNAILNFAGGTVPGDFERTVHIYYTDFENPTVITVSGNIIN